MTDYAELGRKGGQATTDAKANAARENGKKGGRPRKEREFYSPTMIFDLAFILATIHQGIELQKKESKK